MIRHVALAVLFLATWAQTAQADFSQEIRMCDFGGNHPDIRIIACTRNIQSGRFTGGNLAQAFTNRGLAYKRKGLWDKAIADYDEAIRLKPDLAETFINRGTAYYYKGQFDRALKDYDEAIRLKPDLAQAFSNRGTVYNKKGRFDRAIRDYDAPLRRNPPHAHVLAAPGLASHE